MAAQGEEPGAAISREQGWPPSGLLCRARAWTSQQSLIKGLRVNQHF